MSVKKTFSWVLRETTKGWKISLVTPTGKMHTVSGFIVPNVEKFEDVRMRVDQIKIEWMKTNPVRSRKDKAMLKRNAQPTGPATKTASPKK